MQSELLNMMTEEMSLRKRIITLKGNLVYVMRGMQGMLLNMTKADVKLRNHILELMGGLAYATILSAQK